MKRQRFMDTTHNTYFKIWRLFNKFIIRLDELPATWEERLALYVTYLADRKLQSSTIKSYISAIKAVLSFDDYEIKEQKLLLTSLARSCKLKNDRVKTRLPIKKHLLESILNQVDIITNKTNQEFLRKLYKCIFILGYYGLLRISELVGCHAVKARDAHISEEKRKILMLLHTSKTHGRNKKPQEIRIAADKKGGTRMQYNPIDITIEFAKSRGSYVTPNEHFFAFRNNSPVKPRQVRSMLAKCLKNLGLNHKLYSVHSFRIGRATDLMKHGVSVEKIKYLGRWRSNAVYNYIREC